MTRRRPTNTWLCVALLLSILVVAGAARAGDDTARFYGSWTTSFVYNNQLVTMASVHDAGGYKNYVANAPAGDGTFSAANGIYKTNAAKPNDAGIYHFLDDNTVICTNSAGQTVIWKRSGAAPSAVRPGAQPVNPGAAPSSGLQPASPQPTAAQPAALAADPSLPPETNAAIAAFNQKDYNTAWRDFMAAAQKGDAEAEAGVGAMLFAHLNPPGTGYYAQCEKWLLASANQGNAKGMDFLGQYYYASGKSIAGGINPGVNNAPIPPALQKEADGKFALARQWFERAAAKNDGYAMANLAIMLDAGVGGPRDPERAKQLRAGVAGHSDADFAKRATGDPENQAMTASWQSGHYADALKNAEDRAAKGDANAQSLLGRAYYEGVGVKQNYGTAQIWLNKAIAQNNPDAMFFLGMMYEYGRGVNQDIQKALGLFDKAAGLGQRYAQMEAKGMRMEGAAAEQQARFAAVCRSAGGVADGPLCLSGGMAIDPY